MPEGSELKLSSDLLKPLVVNNSITNISFPKTSRYHQQGPDGLVNFLQSISDNNTKIEKIETRGKFMYWTLSKDWYIFITYGMTGQFSPKAGKHICMQIDLQNSPYQIYFNDPRHFGTVKFIKGQNELKVKLNKLGWDPLIHHMDDKWISYLKEKLKINNKPIGELLLDQSLFAGVGNYVRAESLYLAKLSPFKAANLLSNFEINLLCESIVKVMTESYDKQGATISTYSTVYGEEGKYSGFFKVYSKKTDPQGNPVVRQQIGGRTIHWCPNIQL